MSINAEQKISRVVVHLADQTQIEVPEDTRPKTLGGVVEMVGTWQKSPLPIVWTLTEQSPPRFVVVMPSAIVRVDALP